MTRDEAIKILDIEEAKLEDPTVIMKVSLSCMEQHIDLIL